MKILGRKVFEGRGWAQIRTRLTSWETLVRGSHWKDFNELRKTFKRADRAKPKSGKVVVIFNIGRRHRLIANVDYEGGHVYLRRLLKHDEYGREVWKESL